MNRYQLLHLEDYDLSLKESIDGYWAQKRLVHETVSSIETTIVHLIDQYAACDLLIEAEFPTFQQSPIASVRYRNKDQDRTWHKQLYNWHNDHGFTPDGNLKSVDEECIDKIATAIDEAVKNVVPYHVHCYVAQTLRGESIQTIRLYEYGVRELHSKSFTLGQQLIDCYPSMRSNTDWNYTAFFPKPLVDD